MVWRNQFVQEKISKKITIDDIIKIHNDVSVGFGPRVHTHTAGLNSYFVPRITRRPIPTSEYRLSNKKYHMDYYSKSHCCPENLAIARPNIEFSGLGSVNATRKFNHNYMEFWEYKICDKIMWN